jgi:hypothetical protein
MTKMLLLALTCTIPCLAQNSSVEGRVTNQAGEPLKNARIDLRPIVSPFSGIFFDTGSDGNFVLQNIQPGRYSVWVFRPGYLYLEYPTPLTFGSRPAFDRYLPEDDQSRADSRGVVDEDGDPVPNAGITLLNEKMQRVAETDTDVRADGSFVIGEVSAGRYNLCATEKEPPPYTGIHEVSGPQEGLAATYYPSVTDPSRATLVHVEAGAEVRNLEIRMIKTRLSRIRGHVVDAATGLAVGNAVVDLWREQPFSVISRGTPDGSFEFLRLPPGGYGLFSSPRPNSTNVANAVGHQLVTLGADNIDDLILRVGPSLEISGAVIVDGGGTAGGVRIELHTDEGWWIRGGGAEAKNDGTYLLSTIEPAIYHVEVTNLPSGTYLKSIRWGDRDVTGAAIDLTVGTQGKSLDIVLSPHAAELSGAVRDSTGAIVPGATVVLHHILSDSLGGANPGDQTTDQSGAFVFHNLAPGSYKIAAFTGEQSEDFKKRFDAQAASFTLSEDSRYSVAPPLIAKAP